VFIASRRLTISRRGSQRWIAMVVLLLLKMRADLQAAAHDVPDRSHSDPCHERGYLPGRLVVADLGTVQK
jgi:hypothetical protein